MQDSDFKKEIHLHNPSLLSIGNHIKYMKKTISSKPKGKVTGLRDYTEGVTVDERRIVGYDAGKFVKLYQDGIKNLLTLSKTSVDLLLYIMQEYCNRVDSEVQIIPFNVIKELKISRSTYNRAFKELIDKEWIYYSSTRYMYYINLNYMCKEDRLRLHRAYIKAVRK